MTSLPRTYLSRIIQGVSPSNFAAAGCLNPRLLHNVKDPLTGNVRSMYVNCGKCENCQNMDRNEWVTRMCLHSLYWKHCYFVTLSYGSYNLYPFKSHPFQKDWDATFPVFDMNNTSRMYRWTPSILVREHVSKFIKRLRKNTGATLSYAGTGEYGETYGRPHWHLIVWSQSPLTLDNFKDAWSYDCVKYGRLDIRRYSGETDKRRFRFRLGRVQVYDLVANGTLDWKAEYNGSDWSASHCFQYVGKYIHKNTVLNKYAKQRILHAWLMLDIANSEYDLTDLYEKMERGLLWPAWHPGITAYDREHPGQKMLTYYKCFTKKTKSYDVTYNEFEKMVAPSFFCSRGYVIGKQYGVENLSRFQDGNFKLPLFQGKVLTFPAYFHRLVAQKNYPLRLRRHGLLSNSYALGSFPALYAYYATLREDAGYYYAIRALCKDAASARHFTDLDPEIIHAIQVSAVTDTLDGKSIHGFLYEVTMLDPSDAAIHYDYSPSCETFFGWRWNKSTRSYDYYDAVSRIDFCDMVMDLIKEQWKEYATIEQSRQQTLVLYDSIREDPASFDVRDGYLARKEYLHQQYELRHSRKKDYQ